jgi:hypothetical protein
MSVTNEVRNKLGPQSVTPRCRWESGSTNIPECAGFVIPQGLELKALSGQSNPKVGVGDLPQSPWPTGRSSTSPYIPRSEATITHFILSFPPSARLECHHNQNG